MVGGLLMAALWLIFTSVHGPTSSNENRVFLSGESIRWGFLRPIHCTPGDGLVPHDILMTWSC